MCIICTKYIWAHGAGPQKAAGPMGPKAWDPGPRAQGPGPPPPFWARPHGPICILYVCCTYVVHNTYLFHIYFIFISYVPTHTKTIYFILFEI